MRGGVDEQSHLTGTLDFTSQETLMMSAGAGTQTYDATDGRGKSAPIRWNTGTRPKAPNRFAKN